MLNFSNAPHRRYNIPIGEWMLISPHRTKRPWRGKVEKVIGASRSFNDPHYYLCPGNTRASGQVNPAYSDTLGFSNDFIMVSYEVFSNPQRDITEEIAAEKLRTPAGVRT